MATAQNLPPSRRWAQLRFAIVGALLAQPPGPGELHARLMELSAQTWQHPIRNTPVRFSFASIQRWYYAARHQQEPTAALVRSVRRDAGVPRQLDQTFVVLLQTSYRDHASWSYLLHYENFIAGMPVAQQATAPSYATVRRFMRHHGLVPRHLPADRHDTPGARATRARFAHREVRLFEHTHTHALWHIDAHHGSLALSHHGQMQRPALIAIIDDHSRFICHAQWLWHEDAASAAHVLSQAISKRGLPRMLLSDNGGPFVAAEIRHGLHRLGVLHQSTMCYAPNQNGKMEVFWGQVEGRLLAMLRRERGLDLYRLNEMTQAWIEHDYHGRLHAGIGVSPLQRYQTAPDAGRPAPASNVLTQAFTRRESRRQRRSDGSIALGGKRFEIPSRYRHLVDVVVRYASWDLDHVFLAHPDTDAILDRLWPIDIQANASGARREMATPTAVDAAPAPATAPGLPPLLQMALTAARATGLPPAFISLDDLPTPPPVPPTVPPSDFP